MIPMNSEPASPDRTPDRILYLIKSKGPQSAAQLARRLGITAMAVRQHLYRFHANGMVEFAVQRRRVGRPLRLWRLTERAAVRFPESHAELTLELISAVRAAFGEAGIDRLLAHRTARQRRDYRARLRGAGASLAERVRELAAIRSEQGYMSEASVRRDGSILLAENHCPICAAAGACQGLCREELALFRSVLGPGVSVERTDHILAGARRCAYMICPQAGGRSTFRP